MKKCMELYERYKEIVSYLIVGGLTTVVSLGTYYVCVLTFLSPENAIQLQVANIISWAAAVTFAYFMNRKFVFESNNSNILKEAFTFVCARVVTLLMDMFCMFAIVTCMGMSDKIAKLVVQVIVTIANYVFSKVFVFHRNK